MNFYDYLNKISVKNNHYSISFLYNLYITINKYKERKSNIKINDEIFLDFFKRLDMLVSILKEYNIKYSFKIFPGSAPTLSLNLHFEKFLIKNEFNQEHYLHGVTFHIKFTWDFFKGKEDPWLDISRNKFTINELKTNYLHSHYSSYYSEGGSFCLGDSNIIRNFSKFFLKKEITKDNISMSLLLLLDYFGYESLKGKPYKYISDINARKPFSINDINHSNLVRIFKKVFNKEIKNFKFYNYLENSSNIEKEDIYVFISLYFFYLYKKELFIRFFNNKYIFDDQIFNNLFEMFQNKYIEFFDIFLCFKDSSGNFFEPIIEKDSIADIKKYKKENPEYNIIINNDIELDKKENLVISNRIKEIVKEYLENFINKTFYEKYRIYKR